MERRSFSTPHGELWAWSEGFDGEGPLTLVINGAFPRKGQVEALPWLGRAAFAHLPGFYCPSFAAPSVQTFAEAFDAMAESMRAALVVGFSVGGSVALSLRSPLPRLVIEPIVTTRRLWPLHELLAAHDVEAAAAAWNWSGKVLGLYPKGVDGRDFRTLFRPAGARVIVGDVPLMPPRPLSALPSFLLPEDRSALSDGGALLTTVEGGHNVALQYGEMIAATAWAILTDGHREDVGHHAPRTSRSGRDASPVRTAADSPLDGSS